MHFDAYGISLVPSPRGHSKPIVSAQKLQRNSRDDYEMLGKILEKNWRMHTEETPHHQGIFLRKCSPLPPLYFIGCVNYEHGTPCSGGHAIQKYVVRNLFSKIRDPDFAEFRDRNLAIEEYMFQL